MTSPSALECKGSVAGSHAHTDLWRKRQISCVSRWVRGGGENPFGSCFLLHECMCREFVLSVFRAESLQPAMRMVWSHICLAERALGFSWNPSFSSCSSHFRKNMICCENENNDAVAHRAVVINWGERKAALCGSIIWIRWWYTHTHTHNDVTVSPHWGREGGEKERLGLRSVLHSATQSPPRSGLCSITVRHTPSTPPPPHAL